MTDDGLERLALAEEGRAAASHGSGGTATVLQRLAGVALLFAVWELASRAGWLDERTLGAPSGVASTGWDLIVDGTLPRALWASAQRVLWALAIGAPIAVALALVAGLSRVGDAVVDANLQVLRYVPILALQPLLILWSGVGEITKVTLLAIGVAFPVYVNTQAAVRSIHAHHFELAHVLGLSTGQRLRRVIVPGALGGFLVGLRLAVAVAWLLLIVAEQTNAPEGLGTITARAVAFLDTDVLVVVIVTYATVGVGCDLALRFAERHLLRWQARR